MSSVRLRFPLIDARVVVTTLAGVVAVALAFVITRSGSAHLVLLVGLAPLAAAVVWLSPRKTLLALVVWMVMLGFLRRISPGGTTSSYSGDPLLLVGPLVIVLLFVAAALRGGLRARSPFAIPVALLAILGIVEGANPLQGSLTIGLGGILYVVVPMLAFWIGRVFLDDKTLRQLMWVVAVSAAANAVYGLVQTLAGFPSWDVRWIQSAGYAALDVGGSTRAFGSFTSATEYDGFLTLGLVCWVALARRGGPLRIPITLGAVALIGTALILGSQRSAVLLAVVALGLMFAARTGRKLGGAVLAGLVAVALVILVAGQLGSGSSTSTTASSPQLTSGQNVSALTGHLFSGLGSPTGSSSTLGSHVSEMVQGVKDGFTEPLGHGTGVITVAAGHFSSSGASTGAGQSGTSSNGSSSTSQAVFGTESDLGNAGVAFGLLGLLLYVLIAFRALTGAYGLARARRDALSLAALGIVMGTFTGWTNGDLYSVCWLVWLIFGWVDVRHVWRQFDAGAHVGVPSSHRPVLQPVLGGGAGSDEG